MTLDSHYVAQTKKTNVWVHFHIKKFYIANQIGILEFLHEQINVINSRDFMSGSRQKNADLQR